MGRGRRLDLAFADEVDATSDLSDEDRRFAQELAYGTVRLRGRLDHLLDHHLRAGLGGVSPGVLELLRMGAYQLLYMGGVPDYAAVSESVDQARAMAGKGAAGLVNAVLRAVGRSGEDPALFPSPDEDPAAWLATWGSHPRWLVDRWLSRWSVEDVRRLVEADNRVPPVTLLPLASDPDTARALLAEDGIEAEPVGEGSLELAHGTDPAAALGSVNAVVQDPAASLAVRYVDPPPGAVVADLCAAPGGKALALAASGVHLVATDRSGPRLALLRANAERTGLPLRLARARAQEPCIREADVVLLDVPCTGTGTLRRHPDARWRLSSDTIDELVRIQDDILHGGANVVSSGGLLVYSTCSLEREENQDRVRAFLEKRDDFRLDPGDAVSPEYLDDEGYLEVLPQRAGFDGAFAARLRRVRT